MHIFNKILKKSYLLVVAVQLKGFWIPIILVIPLQELEEVIESFSFFIRLGTFFTPQVKIRLSVMNYFSGRQDWRQIIDFPLIFFKEMRKSGRFTLVEVKDQNVYITVRLM